VNQNISIRGFFFFLFILTSPSFRSKLKTESEDWGFFGHKRINRLAVFTLHPDMMPLFKNSIEYLSEHAVDADKRRYAIKEEGIRHFIDLDIWQQPESSPLPRDYPGALGLYGDFVTVDSNLGLLGPRMRDQQNKRNQFVRSWTRDTIIEWSKLREFIQFKVLPRVDSDESWKLKGSEINESLGISLAIDSLEYKWVDTFSQHGILPYHLEHHFYQLVEAFKTVDHKMILRHAADIGHYIGDAHVPLHTSSNYNGQKTNQLGLHAFWESRIPELFADETYDYFVGKADYIPDIKPFIWDIVIESHKLVDSTLAMERKVSNQIPRDMQYCFDTREGIPVRLPCRAYALAYSQEMQGMVERRMREAIKAVGSVWYTAWIVAGQPKLSRWEKNPENGQIVADTVLDTKFRSGRIIGRPEEN
jgi:hypothetical protein